MSANLLDVMPGHAAPVRQRVVLQVDDMTGGVVVDRVAAALAAVDSRAAIRIDLDRRRLDIESALADAYDFADAIASAGCTPVLVLWHGLGPR
jgi:copper chaperone CopZ